MEPTALTPDREQVIERICQAALERDRLERDAFLASACGTDLALRREVEALLAHEDTAAGFLDGPALAAAARELSVAGQTLSAGQRLGHYTILSRLGAGGMGEVYRARDGTLGRDVAIKINVVPQLVRRSASTSVQVKAADYWFDCRGPAGRTVRISTSVVMVSGCGPGNAPLAFRM